MIADLLLGDRVGGGPESNSFDRKEILRHLTYLCEID